MTLYCWGSTINGELGMGGVEDEHILKPRELDWLLAGQVNSISCGQTHSLMLTNDGKLYACGQNDFGQLGHEQPRKRPHLVTSLVDHVINRACCGSSHSVALNEWGNVFTWGSNSFSQLGFPTDKSEPIPKLVKALGTKHIVQIAAGNHHNIALSNEGELFAWGLNHSGQCGLGDIKKISMPTKISTLNGIPIAFIACGGSHSFVVSKSGAVFGFGKNNSGQLGVGDCNDRLYPTQLKTLRNIGVRYISAGEDFSVFLTQEGGVLTCGSGSYGQTAHGINTNEMLPRMVLEMMGTTCTQVACGARHCLTFVPSRGRIYGFGLGSSGQLGNRSTNNALLPQIVVGPWASPSGQTLLDRFNTAINASFVKRIFSGGDHSFATTTTNYENLPDCRFYDSKTQIECMTSELFERCAQIGESDTVDLTLMSSIEIIFKSLSCINGSFLESSGGSTSCSMRNHGINIEKAEIAFHLIQTMENKTLKNVIWDSITTQLLPTLIMSPPDVEALRIYLLLPLYHEFINAKKYAQLHTQYGRFFLGMTKIAQKVVMHWWADASVEYFVQLISHFKNVVWYILNHKLQKVIIKFRHDDGVPNPPRGLIKFDIHLETALNVLKDLFYMNRFDRKKPVPHETFYVPGLAESVQLQKDFCDYFLCQYKGETGVFLSNWPFIFDAPAKKLILQTDQGIQMCKAVHQSHTSNLQSGLGILLGEPDPDDSNITFTVSRDHLVEDTINEIVKFGNNELKKPLKVKFVGEEGEDAGGLQKEFFMLLQQKLFSSEYGMFKSYDDSRLIWFSDSSFEGERMFQLVGTLVALALYNFKIINIPFPLALYKKLLNEKLELSDLSELSPTLGKSMRNVLEHEGDDMEDVFDLTFEISREIYGHLVTVPLKDNGENIRVNQSNKNEFVDLYIDYVFNKSVEMQYTAFHEGFKIVCEGPVLNMFQAYELRDVVIGNENYDWDVFENNAIYKEGYTSSDPTIRLFWEVFHELTLEEKKNFLLFLTGSDRIPLDGMKAIIISIQPISDDKYLPVAHTCFDLLDLPRYQTKEKLRFKLLQAIQQNQGFSLV